MNEFAARLAERLHCRQRVYADPVWGIAVASLTLESGNRPRRDGAAGTISRLILRLAAIKA